MRKKAFLWILIAVLIAVLLVAGVNYYVTTVTSSFKRRLVISTTTSLFDTGLLDRIEDRFEAEYPIDLYFISVGTGLAIKFAQRGDADMILVHAPPLEEEFLEGGYGVCRKIIAYNFFFIVGPDSDPAGIEGLSPVEALTRIVEAGRAGKAVWVSRGDNSGTHSKEKALWRTAGFEWEELKEEEWYRESGTGMGKTLQITNEFSAYTLTDTGTYLKYKKEELIDLVPLVEEGEELINVYSAIAVNPAKHSEVNFEDAITFIKYLISDQGQQVIANYGKDQYGTALFNPVVQLLKNRTDPKLVEWIENYAFFNGSECPQEYRDDHWEMYNQK